jgi:hypothetical protein
MNYILSKSHIKMLKIIVNIWAVIITALTIAASFVFISQGGYNHPFLFFEYLLAITSYINIYRFYKMLYNNNHQISSLQLKIWSMLFFRGVFFSCLYLSFYAKNILGIVVFLVIYLLTFVCNHYLIKANNNGIKQS